MGNYEELWKQVYKRELNSIEAKLSQGVKPILGGVAEAIEKQKQLDARKAGPHFVSVQRMLSLNQLLKAWNQLGQINDLEDLDKYKREEFLAGLAQLKEFNLDWFEKNIGRLTEKQEKIFAKNFYEFEAEPVLFLQYGYNFKIMTPEAFKKLPDISQDMWNKIAAVLRQWAVLNNWQSFILYYYKAAFIDYAETSRRIKLTDFWPAIVNYLKSFKFKDSDYWEIMAACQVVRPNTAEKIVVTRHEWEKLVMDNLRLTMVQVDLKFFIQKAVGVKYLHVS